MGVNLGLLWILGANAGTTVFVPLGPLLHPPVETPERAPLAFIADDLRVMVRPGEETGLDLTWRISPLSPGWVDLALVGSELAVSAAELNGRRATLTSAGDGMLHLPLFLEGPVTVHLEGTVKTPASALKIRALGGARQRVQVEGPWELSSPGAVRLPGGLVLGGDPQNLAFEWRPQGPAAEKPPLLRADVASAARLDSGGVEVQAILRYRVVRGAFQTLQFRLDPSAEDLDVVGDGVDGVERSGELVTVRLARPLTDHLELRVGCRRGAGGEALPLPWPLAAEAEGFTTLNRGDESLIVPEAGVGAVAVGGGSLPAWARGLLEGEPVVSYRLSGESPQVSARAMRWEPIDGPPTVVDEARYEVATADHGRLMLRARYQVRNDRRQFLRMRAPEGYELVSVMVAGRLVQPARDADGTLLIPLEKSVETLQGLVTFPVDVAFLGAEAPWAQRGERTASTPSIDAPIAYARWELVLPPGFSGEVEDSTATVVPDWSSRSQTLQYGHAYGDKNIEGIDANSYVLDGIGTNDEEASQQAWNQAYQAYKENRFDDSRELIEQSLAYNPSNQAAQALSGNLSVLLDDSDVGGDSEMVARRVKDMARARSGDAERQQETLQAKADEAIRAGDYEEAEKTLEELVQVSGVLASVEQSESMDKKAVLSSSTSQLATVKEELKKKSKGVEVAEESVAKVERPAGKTLGWSAPTTTATASATPPAEPPAVDEDNEYALDRQPATPEMPVLLPEPVEGGSSDTNQFEFDASEVVGDLLLPSGGEELEALPYRDGYATVIINDAIINDVSTNDVSTNDVIMNDPMAVQDLQDYTVLDPDIAALLYATDVTGYMGDEWLDTEVVLRGFGAYGMGYGAGGSGYGSGLSSRSSSGSSYSATTAGVVIPHAGSTLKFEARLVPEGQPLSATISYRAARRR